VLYHSFLPYFPTRRSSDLEQFKKVWKPEWNDAAKALGRTPQEIVTIASLIETETGVESERPIVAGIINNRLSKKVPLGIDQTVRSEEHTSELQSRSDLVCR